MRDYLIPEILPSREVHLFAGPSGAGKTRLMFQWIKDWKEGKLILGRKPKDINIAYAAYDRSHDSIQEIMDQLHITTQHLKWKSVRNTKPPLHKIPAMFPDCQLLVVDAIGDIPLPTGNANSRTEVAHFMVGLGIASEVQDVTILGILHCPKMKEGERYLNPRQRIAGSAAWAAYGDTVFLFEPIEADNPENDKRKLYVLPRNAREFTVSYTKNSHGIFEVDLSSALNEKEQIIYEILNGSAFSAKDLEQKAEQFGISRATLFRTLKSLLSANLCEKNIDGLYVAKPVTVM